MTRARLLAALIAVVTAVPVSAAVEVGDPSPAVVLPDQDNHATDIAENYGQRYTALAFYPHDDTKGCTLEAQSVNKALTELQQSGIVVYGVSVQGVDSKKEFCNKYGLQQTMLSDVDKTVCEAFGTLNDRGMSNRVTVILDPSLTIRLIDRQVKVQNHAEDIIAAVNKLREDDLASALGKLGEPTMIGGEMSIRLPEGWTANGPMWVSPDQPKVGVALAREATAIGDPSEWVTSHLGDRELRAERAIPIADVTIQQFETKPDGDGLARCGVVYIHDGQAEYLEGWAPAADAGALARLVAEMVASIGY